VFAPTDGAISYAARTGTGGALCLDHADGWSTSYSGLDTVLVPSRDRCSGRRKPRVRSGDVIGYLRGAIRLGFGLSRWENGAWTAADPADCLHAWAVQPWFTDATASAGAALAI
jgi:murein DD-endopeptidase MepM/ murein hydrolase activator NlpD